MNRLYQLPVDISEEFILILDYPDIKNYCHLHNKQHQEYNFSKKTSFWIRKLQRLILTKEFLDNPDKVIIQWIEWKAIEYFENLSSVLSEDKIKELFKYESDCKFADILLILAKTENETLIDFLFRYISKYNDKLKRSYKYCKYLSNKIKEHFEIFGEINLLPLFYISNKYDFVFWNQIIVKCIFSDYIVEHKTKSEYTLSDKQIEDIFVFLEWKDYLCLYNSPFFRRSRLLQMKSLHKYYDQIIESYVEMIETGNISFDFYFKMPNIELKLILDRIIEKSIQISPYVYNILKEHVNYCKNYRSKKLNTISNFLKTYNRKIKNHKEQQTNLDI